MSRRKEKGRGKIEQHSVLAKRILPTMMFPLLIC